MPITFRADPKAIQYSMNSGTELDQIAHTLQTSCRSGWPRGSVLTPEYLLPPQWFQCSVHTTPKCDTEPIQYVTLHWWDRRGAVQLRSITEISPKSPFFVCEPRPYPVWGVSSVNIVKGKSDISCKNTLKTAFYTLNAFYIYNLHSWIL